MCQSVFIAELLHGSEEYLFLRLSELPTTRNWCSLGASFGGSFGMGRGCRTRLRLRHSSPFPAHSLIALGPHSAKRSHAIPCGFGYGLFLSLYL